MKMRLNILELTPNLQKRIEVRLTDAYLRLGDCNFMAAKYWPAMDAYNKAIDMKSVDADYAAFQKESAMDL